MSKSLKEKVLKRQQELECEYGDSEIDEITINEILRDEFQGEDYEAILIELGINDEDLGIEEQTDKSEENSESRVNIDENKLFNIFLNLKTSIDATEHTLRGRRKINGKWVKVTLKTLPSKEIDNIIEFLRDITEPQSLVAKLKMDIIDFSLSLNLTINGFLSTLEDYPDDIVDNDMMKSTISLILTKTTIVVNLVKSGRLGDLLRDMVIGSYNEKSEDKVKTKEDSIKDFLDS